MLMDGTSPKTDNFKRLALTDEGIIIFFERYLLASSPGKVYSKEQIYNFVWKEPYFGDYNILIPYSKLNLNI